MKITAIGGYSGVGKNMTLVSEGRTQIALDCGIKLDSFLLYYGRSRTQFEKIPNEELLSIGAIPNLDNISGNIDAFLISHGHLDHIGAISKYINKYRTDIYGTPFANNLIRNSVGKNNRDNVYDVNYGETLQLTQDISAEYIQVTHSIPQASFVHVNTPRKNVFYACDFKLDDYSEIAETDYHRLKQIGREGVDILVVESLAAGREGKTPSESIAREKVKDYMRFAAENEKLILATTFSTHVERIQTLVDNAKRVGRQVIILGRSYLPNCTMGEKLKILDLPPDTIVLGRNYNAAMEKIRKNGRENFMLLVTGHQGEPDSVLSRLANKELKLKLEDGDAVLFASSTIPTDVNIANKSELLDKLKGQGVRIFEDAHVSGHASAEEHRKLLKLLNPEHIIPAHGETRMIGDYVQLAESEGYSFGTDLHMLRDGMSIEF